MARLHDLSIEATKSEVDLFSIPTTQIVIDSNDKVKHLPLASLQSSNEIEFVIPGSEDFLDMNSLELEVHFKLTKTDGSNLTDDSVLTTGTSAGTNDINYVTAKYFLHALFQEVEIELNGTRITQSGNTYPYRAFLDARLFTDRLVHDSYLAASFFIPEKDRAKLVEKSKPCQLYGAVHADICQQSKLLLNHVPVKVKLLRTNDNFSLYRNATAALTGGVKVELSKCFLWVRKVRLSAPAEIDLSNRLLTQPAVYFITRTEVKTFHVPQGQPSHSEDHLFMGVLPRKFVVMLLPTTRFNGDLTQNPFAFDHCKITNMFCVVDHKMIPGTPYTPDFEKNLYTREYYSLFDELNMTNSEPNLSISFTDFKKQFPLFVFDLSPDRSDGPECGTVSLQKRGNVRLEFRCAEALTVPYTLLVYAHFDGLIQIDKERNVTKDF